MRALEAALGSPWAITEAALEQILTIAARENDVTPEALEKYRLEMHERAERLGRRGNVAVLSAMGPMFHRANLFTEISGATSYQGLRRDLQVATDDRDISSILLDVDSPGGHAHGAAELAKAIHDSPKPVVAYVGGQAASGGYWLASAAREIVVDDMAQLGSIGVLVSLVDSRAREKAEGVKRFEFISSQSPLKRGDPTTKEGAGEFQRMADDMADVFIATVAKHRGVDAETVANGFGRGGMLIASRAVAAGMADRIGTFEETLERMMKGGAPKLRLVQSERRPAASNEAASAAITAAQPAATHTQKESTMGDQTEAGATTADLDTIRKEAASTAVQADRQRRASIMALEETQGREALAERLHATTEMSVEEIRGLLAAAPAPAAAAAASPDVPAEPAIPATEASAYDTSSG